MVVVYLIHWRKRKPCIHKDCYSKFNKSHLLKCEQSHQQHLKTLAEAEDPEVVSRKRNMTEIGSAVCLFCGEADSRENLCPAKELHASGDYPNTSHVKSLTKSWKEMTLQLGELDIHTKLSIGDVRASKIFYHKIHYVQFRNRYKALSENKGKTEEMQETP